uniref:G-protein coupled receptors family 1 profile domain-containing protein n=3 Tax=Wuchereria bancrofti TaxID=6293 RepID=A0AAF5PV81_WUCBA
MASSTTSTYEHILRTLPGSFVRSKIFRIVMQVLASSTSYNDESSTLPELTFIFNHTITPSLHFKQTSMNDNIINGTNEALSNITVEYIQQKLDHPKFICIIAIGSVFAFLTTGGNLMVMVSFKIDKQLQTISNYFLFSLAVADIAIGIVSIPVMTYYMAADTVWGLGYAMCQFWLCLDYMMCNASVLNLLLISFDRYFSVTRPLTYRPRRTAKKAFMMIASTYIASALLWPPWIISWPYIEGRFTHPDRCVVQFIETNQFASVGTTIAAFWLPLVIMIILYSRVYYETKKQQKDMCLLQAGQNQHKKDKKKAQSNASTNSTKNSSVGRTKNSSSNFSSKIVKKQNCCLRIFHEKTVGSSMEESGGDVQQIGPDEVSEASSNYIRYYSAQNRLKRSPQSSLVNQENNSLLTETISRAGGRISRKDKSSTYTVLIELKDSEEGQSRIRLSSCDSDIFEPARSEPDRIEDVRKNMVSQQLLNGTVLANKLFNEQRKSEKERRKNERKQESKAAKTLSAILLAFIITWTPYNVIVCWEAFYKDSIPAVYFHIAYFLCYINSTINPFCYAFCNPRFRLTYMRILTGNWKRQNTLGLSKMAFLNRS